MTDADARCCLKCGQWSCPRCGAVIDLRLPVEPVMPLTAAAVLLGLTVGSLKYRLKRYGREIGLAPALYRTVLVRGRQQRIRVLRASDIQALYAHMYSTEHWPSDGRRRLTQLSLFDAAEILRSATAPRPAP